MFARRINKIIAFLIVYLALTPGSACAQTVQDPYFKNKRMEMVKEQIVARGVADEKVCAAMEKVPRHEFVPANLKIFAYLDRPLPIGYDQTISQPYIVALMTELGHLGPEDKVLEIGTGSGYQAAILAEIVKEVYTIEILEPLAEMSRERLKAMGYDNVQVKCGDGYLGWEEYAPYDAIIVTAAPKEVPPILIEQLKIGGRMVIPVGSFYQELKVITKTESAIEEQSIIPVRFVPMIHSEKEQEQ